MTIRDFQISPDLPMDVTLEVNEGPPKFLSVNLTSNKAQDNLPKQIMELADKCNLKLMQKEETRFTFRERV